MEHCRCTLEVLVAFHRLKKKACFVHASSSCSALKKDSITSCNHISKTKNIVNQVFFQELVSTTLFNHFLSVILLKYFDPKNFFQ